MDSGDLVTARREYLAHLFTRLRGSKYGLWDGKKTLTWEGPKDQSWLFWATASESWPDLVTLSALSAKNSLLDMSLERLLREPQELRTEVSLGVLALPEEAPRVAKEVARRARGGGGKLTLWEREGSGGALKLTGGAKRVVEKTHGATS